MKTVCKKLLCLMLVAMMLVSAVPFAFAAEGDLTACPNPEHEGLQWTKKADKHVDPKCKEAGQDVYYCGGGHEYTVEIPELGHDWDGGVVTKEATCTETGTLLYSCERGCTEPATIPVIEHEDGDVCTICGFGVEEEEEDEPETVTLTFVYLDEDGEDVFETAEVEVGGEIEFPDVPDVSTKDFLDKWKGSNGKYFYDGDEWYGGMPTTFIAQYKSDTTQDDIVELEVWAYYYVDGEYHHREKLYTKNFEKSNKNTMYTWLYSDNGMDTTADALEAEGYDGYEWTNMKYYNHYDDQKITEASMKSDGPKSVYIKVNSTKDIEANVMLYVHTKETAAVDRVIPMPGYTAGDKVTYNDVKSAVKTKYTGSKMTISDLYTESAWEDLLDDLKASGAKTVEVEDNGTTEIHVIVKNASDAKADSSNPKTGDNIMIAATTMALAAAALVSMYELKKRNMI